MANKSIGNPNLPKYAPLPPSKGTPVKGGTPGISKTKSAPKKYPPKKTAPKKASPTKVWSPGTYERTRKNVFHIA